MGSQLGQLREPLQLYNSLSRAVEPLRPAPATVTMYVCGITPYATTHLGHAFTYAAADILIRFIEDHSYRVRYVQNLTDIDDAILREAHRVGEDWRALGNRWTMHFIREMQTLNIRPPDLFPRATNVITDIIATVRQLLEAGVAYVAGGSVYFHVDAWPSYGKLSRIPRDQMVAIANERGNRPDDPHKRDPLDFVLWQAQAPGEPAWDSPWGPGRPGWHIECSTMVHQFLGETVDIHGGGTDLIFPHHESEIAQAACATGREPFARWWFHTAMVQHAGKKISKSLGNLIMLQDLLQTYSPDALRLYLAGHHYRQVWQHNLDELERAEQLARTLWQAATAPGGSLSYQLIDPTPSWVAFTAALARDLDTPNALEILAHLADEIVATAQDGHSVKKAQTTLRRMARTFGLRLDAAAPEPMVMAGWNAHIERAVR
jgi:L-cysteine:1D-myo-inositol 2-amino-2-deoxy-alpha-D-glucopyranoside ligase